MNILNFPKRDETENIKRSLDKYARYSRYIIQSNRRQHVIKAIEQARSELEQNNIQAARTNLDEAIYQITLARYRNQLLFYAEVPALGISAIYLVLFFSVTALAVWYDPVRENSILFSVLLALAGGGIGGVTTVLSKIIGIQPETQAFTTRRTWYIVKPILGTIMGLVTYFAILSGFSLLSDTFQIDNMAGVFLIGFLGGYLESFSTRVLNNISDRIVDTRQPETVKTDSQVNEDLNQLDQDTTKKSA